jgi:hypothetical protein
MKLLKLFFAATALAGSFVYSAAQTPAAPAPAAAPKSQADLDY